MAFDEKAYQKEYRKNNADKIKAYKLNYRQKHSSKIKEGISAWKMFNREHVREYERQYRKQRRQNGVKFPYEGTIETKLKTILRNRLWDALKGQRRPGSPVRDLGCSVVELRQHLEAQFQSGMSWANYGDWHIDHIKPLSKFDLTDEAQFKEAVHYTNLQPLWATDNLKKSNK